MGFFSFFRKKKNKQEVERVGGMEDFMTLIRVYYQASMAANIGITNINMLPDLATFKRSLKVPTQNNKLGVGERTKCRKMLEQLYGLDEMFFKEVDASVKKNCKKLQDAQPFLFAFQGFNNDLIMLVGNLMKWKFRVPGFMRKMLRSMVEKTINDIFTKNKWKDEATYRTVYSVRNYNEKFGYSQAWITEYVYKIISLAKKEPRKKMEDAEKK